MPKRIVIMAGGTGGHVFPALAVAHYLKSLDWEVSWIGTQTGMENRWVADAGIAIDYLKVQGIRGKTIGSKLTAFKQLLQSLWDAYGILRQRQPDVVLGMGGYVAGPGGLIASWLGKPLVIHEQNRIPGTTNRILMNRATRVLEAFPGSFPMTVSALCTGNPLRREFVDFPDRDYWQKEKRNFRILVVGGSQGAKVLNDVIPVAVKKLQDVEIKHQTGMASMELVSQKYQNAGLNADVFEFIQDMASAYSWADMVICRAGAMTVSEIAAAGLPSVLVPLPHAIDDHQRANARYLADEGAAILIEQNELNETSLINAIEQIQHNLESMSRLARSKARLDATDRVAEVCIVEADV